MSKYHFKESIGNISDKNISFRSGMGKLSSEFVVHNGVLKFDRRARPEADLWCVLVIHLLKERNNTTSE